MGFVSTDFIFVKDDMGSVVAVVDANGIVVERYEYGDYGQRKIFDAQENSLTLSASGNAYGFTGRWFDDATELYHFRARYYDPETGRFISRDPIGIWGDPSGLGNGYTYAGSNPWTFTDPTGLEKHLYKWTDPWNQGDQGRFGLFKETLRFSGPKKSQETLIPWKSLITQTFNSVYQAMGHLLK